MTDVAQTNLQLYGQLRASGISGPDLERLAGAYEIVMRRCAGMYRPNGKPFVCHLVGTASILHRVGASMDIVTAGLLHSVYKHGDFGLGTGRVTDKHRATIRYAVGSSVENLVFRYTHFEWDHNRLDETLDLLPNVTEDERDILLMRLADLLDDHLDLGRLYERSASKEASRRERRDAYSRLARAAGFPELADTMDRISDQMAIVPVVNGMILDRLGRSFLIVPASYRQRMIASLASGPEAAVRQFRRALRLARRLRRPESTGEEA